MELSSKPYGRDQQFLKSVKTYKPVIEITLANNPPGTKLEVILKVEDRIGFEAQDTLYIEYIGEAVDEPIAIPLYVLVLMKIFLSHQKKLNKKLVFYLVH